MRKNRHRNEASGSRHDRVDSMSMVVDPIWSWPLATAVSLGLLAFVWLTYPPRIRHLAIGRQRLLLSLRMVTTFWLLVAIWRPGWQFSTALEENAQLFVLVDQSRSMLTADGPGSQTRWATAQEALGRVAPLWSGFGERIQIRRHEFDGDLSVEGQASSEPTGRQTALGHVLEQVFEATQRQRTLGVLLLSDGAQRPLPPRLEDPREVARRFGENGIPIYPVALGTPGGLGQTVDLALEDLLIDPVVFEKKIVPLKVRLRAQGALGQTARVKVYVEDRSQKPLGESGVMAPARFADKTRPAEEVILTKANESLPLELSFLPTQTGEIKVAVEVEAVTDELVQRNNRVETIITVRRGGLKVAYFDRLRPEVRSLLMLNGSEKIQLDFQEVRVRPRAAGTSISPQWFDPGRYDAYILGDIPPEALGPKLMRALAARVQEGSGLMVIAGFQNFVAPGYGITPLAELIPVDLDVPGATVQTPVPMQPTALGLRRYLMQLDNPDQNAALWSRLAPLEGAVKLVPRAERVEVLAASPEGWPLLLADEVGKARVLTFAGNSTWLWPLQGEGAAHQRFWRQVVLWLTRKEADSDQAVWVKVQPRTFSPGSIVPLEFGARNDAGEPRTDVTFAVEITNPAGEKQQLTPAAAAGAATSAEFRDTLAPGDYWIRVTAMKDGASLGIDGVTRFVVDARDPEIDQPAADHELLNELAKLSGGTVSRVEDFTALVQRLQQNKLEDLEQMVLVTLWDKWWLIAAFVASLTGEWAFRKRFGLV